MALIPGFRARRSPPPRIPPSGASREGAAYAVTAAGSAISGQRPGTSRRRSRTKPASSAAGARRIIVFPLGRSEMRCTRRFGREQQSREAFQRGAKKGLRRSVAERLDGVVPLLQGCFVLRSVLLFACMHPCLDPRPGRSSSREDEPARDFGSLRRFCRFWPGCFPSPGMKEVSMADNRLPRVLTDQELDAVSAGCSVFGQFVASQASDQPSPGAFGQFVSNTIAQNPGLIATAVHLSQQLC